MSPPADEFAHYLEEWGVDPADEKAAAALFADWLAQQTGLAIIGGPAGEPPLSWPCRTNAAEAELAGPLPHSRR